MNFRGPIRIALVENHLTYREGIASLLSSTGEFEILIMARHGSDLVAQLNEAIVLPEICLMDLNMPIMDGHKTLEVLKSQWPSVKVLILSTFLCKHNVLRTLKAGANGVFDKGGTFEELRDALNDVYEKDFHAPGFVSPEIIRNAKRSAIVIPLLTEREEEFAILCCDELTYPEIAVRMNVNRRTVDGYRESIFKKLALHSRQGIVAFAFKAGLIAD